MNNQLKGGRRIDDWRPEDEKFWQNGGSRVATRNLFISIPALLLAFSVWVIWSVIVVRMPEVGFQFDKAQLSWLLALPALSGATMRLFYAFFSTCFWWSPLDDTVNSIFAYTYNLVGFGYTKP